LNNISSTDENLKQLALPAADAFKDLVCQDYPSQETINISLLIALL
jgi:hypothetical protein